MDFALAFKKMDPVFKYELKLLLGELKKRHQYGHGILTKAISSVQVENKRRKRETTTNSIGTTAATIVNYGFSIYPEFQKTIDDGFEKTINNFGRYVSRYNVKVYQDCAI